MGTGHPAFLVMTRMVRAQNDKIVTVMIPPEALSRFPPRGATLADRRSRIRCVPDRAAPVAGGGLL
ncbi:hypothetical protein CAL14_15595 [Bordetella genomosp. 9]|nr:hypothetical protein CAL14_15595 [Bordetella genomosp. 9]